MISPNDRAYLAALCLARAGLKIDPDKTYLIESRRAPVARREGFLSPADFIGALRTRRDDRMNWAAVEALVMPEPEFFRDRTVFERLATEVLPDLIARRQGEPVRIWSTACGTGQGIYSLALMLPETPGLTRTGGLLGSDLL